MPVISLQPSSVPQHRVCQRKDFTYKFDLLSNGNSIILISVLNIIACNMWKLVRNGLNGEIECIFHFLSTEKFRKRLWRLEIRMRPSLVLRSGLAQWIFVTYLTIYLV